MDPSEIHFYLTDDCDQDDMEMRVSRGENGDWYLSVCRQGDHATNHCVRITTSGSRYPGAAGAVFDLWTAMSTSANRHLAMAGESREEQTKDQTVAVAIRAERERLASVFDKRAAHRRSRAEYLRNAGLDSPWYRDRDTVIRDILLDANQDENDAKFIRGEPQPDKDPTT